MIKIAICDDNSEEMELSKKIISEIIQGYKIPYTISEFYSAEMLLQTDLDFHLVFLDIMLEEKNGIDVGNEIYRRNRQAEIIFQTNFDDYYKEALNCSHAFAYLEKPLTEEKVKVQLDAFMEDNQSLANPYVNFQNVIWIHDGEKETKLIVSLPIQDIMYFECIKGKKRVEIVTKDSVYICKSTLIDLENKMKAYGFAISCRGILVNLNNVEMIRGYDVYLKNGMKVSLSQKLVRKFKKELADCIQNSIRRR